METCHRGAEHVMEDMKLWRQWQDKRNTLTRGNIDVKSVKHIYS